MAFSMCNWKRKSDGVSARRNGELLELASPLRAAPIYGQSRLVALLLILMTLSQSASALLTTPPFAQSRSQTLSLRNRATNESSLLECLEVTPPVLSPTDACQQTLMVHTFAYSYGQPFVGQYNPPNCSFNRVTINFTVTSAGRQFDRLALMFLDDTEVFRTSTAEPTQSGIIWSYVKDMSGYLALFKTPQKIIFDLGNIVDDTYTGLWNTTLTATFFTADDAIEPADVIIPISAQKSSEDASSAFVVPETRAVNSATLPKNAKKAVFSISACGQAAEEFWWSNVLSSDTTAFGNDTTLYGHSAFRELRLLIDGTLAGVSWPFPVIFTGGVVPGFWRPVVGIDAFDLRDDEIDITPFIPLLSDDQPHSFEIQVLGVDDDGHGHGNFTTAIGSNWVVTGKIFVWLDSSNNPTTGTIATSRSTSAITLQSTTHGNSNASESISLDYSIQVTRNVDIRSTIDTPTGSKTVTWTQKLTFSNVGTLSNGGNDQIVRQSTTGTHTSSSDYSRSFEYPLWVLSSYNAPAGGNVTIDASMDRSKNVLQQGDLAFPNDLKTFDYTRLRSMPYSNQAFLSADLKNRQNGTASYLSVPALKKSFGSGNTEQRLTLSDGTQEVYQRHIVASNDSIVYDDQSFGGQARGQSKFAAPGQQGSRERAHDFAATGVRAMLGRGPL
ncbi:unnamed protein product [Alternaria alternata]|jgi:hypothetical protein|nr:hypothetical protein AA0115_g5218 [Alternaria tenuissima]RYN57574.1 hypothetical protein AA0118_g7794 [Alternaria tenuissima]RYN76549.1 hypothetical protein AA0117_g5601 [Alternaria alternata]RYN81251.1 hypothetical protein AA0120_g10207 [Alternaria tenuissima]